jgi:serine/threonine protein kinase
MGEVYLAQDTKLDRKVALKILPADVETNLDRMRRFVQGQVRFRAESSHPNYATAHHWYGCHIPGEDAAIRQSHRGVETGAGA